MADPSTIDKLLNQFTESVLINRNKYLHFAWRFVHNRSVVDDLVNDSFAKFWEKRHEIPEDTNLEAYFYIIIKHTCLNWLRTKKIHFEVQSKIYDASYRLLEYDITTLESFDPNLIFRSEIRDILLEQLEKMPELTRQIFMDNRFNALSYEQIAEKYNVSYRKVGREIQSVLDALRIPLKDYLPAGAITLICSIILNDLK